MGRVVLLLLPRRAGRNSEVSDRIPLSLLSVVAVLAGLFLIVKFALKLEDVGGPVEEAHIPGLDADVQPSKEPSQ